MIKGVNDLSMVMGLFTPAPFKRKPKYKCQNTWWNQNSMRKLNTIRTAKGRQNFLKSSFFHDHLSGSTWIEIKSIPPYTQLIKDNKRTHLLVVFLFDDVRGRERHRFSELFRRADGWAFRRPSFRTFRPLCADWRSGSSGGTRRVCAVEGSGGLDEGGL